MSAEQTVDLSNPREKGLLLTRIREAQGKHRITIVKWRPRRSLRQNSYYWPAFIEPFADYLRAQGDGITNDEVHEFFKAKFLRREVVDKATGEVIGETIASTTTLTTAEFNEYLDKCAAWLWTALGIPVGSPSDYHEKSIEVAK